MRTSEGSRRNSSGPRIPSRSGWFGWVVTAQLLLLPAPATAGGSDEDAAPRPTPALTGEAATPAPPERPPHTVLLGLEMSIIGLSFGPRVEHLWRLGGPGSVSHLRTHLGVLGGPEFVFVPMGLGYRAVFREDKTVQPLVGLGYEAHFFLTDGPVFSQLAAIYLETGCGFAIDDRFSVGGSASLDWTLVGERGPGLQARLFSGYRF